MPSPTTFSVSMASGKKTLADLMNLIKRNEEGEGDFPPTPSASQEQGDTEEASGQTGGPDPAHQENVISPEELEEATGVETEIFEDDFGDDELRSVGNPKKRKRDSGKALSVMEKNFDAEGFIESQLLPGTEAYFHKADLSGQARWIYRSLLRVAAIAKKVEPVLGNYHAMEVKLRNSQKDLTDSRSWEESLKTNLTDRERKAEEDAKEINRLVDRDMALMKNLNASRGETAAMKKRVEELEEKLKSAECSAEAVSREMTALKKRNKDLVKGARDAVKLTEEGIKLQVAVLALDLDLSQVGAMKTVEGGKIVDIL
ncbi:uncharacterized protein [Arachis hypogaea]|uniref:uncharacterized protein n=1 Tax=Arachis hypogaea TaxID=3818 RepID=UPI003B2212C1